MNIENLTEKDKGREVIYTHPKVKKGKIEFEKKEVGRLMGWNDTTLFIRFGIENLDDISLKAFFHRHGAQEHFTGCPVDPVRVEFKNEEE
ncbi:MAG: hypothetical protein WC495_06830 [Patescibacteria group bacterium]|jgi:hypothetical protein